MGWEFFVPARTLIAAKLLTPLMTYKTKEAPGELICFVGMTQSTSPTVLQGWFGKHPKFTYLDT